MTAIGYFTREGAVIRPFSLPKSRKLQRFTVSAPIQDLHLWARERLRPDSPMYSVIAGVGTGDYAVLQSDVTAPGFRVQLLRILP